MENGFYWESIDRARLRWDRVAKPLHSLGMLEDMVTQIAGIQETNEVQIAPRCALIFCGDHGVVAQGVSQSGSKVTALVARSIAEGGANINPMAQVSRTDAFAVDMDMVEEVRHPAMILCRQGAGTKDMTQG